MSELLVVMLLRIVGLVWLAVATAFNVEDRRYGLAAFVFMLFLILLVKG